MPGSAPGSPVPNPRTCCVAATLKRWTTGTFQQRSLMTCCPESEEGETRKPYRCGRRCAAVCSYASDAPPSQSQSVDADAQPDASDDLPEVCRSCQCTSCGNEDCVTQCWENDNEVQACQFVGYGTTGCNEYKPKENAQCQKAPAQKMAAAATTETSVATTECPDISTLTNVKKSAAPASPADAGAATQSLSAADPASLAAPPSGSLAFDFGADAETNAALLADAQTFMAGSMARVMAAKRAHDRTANNYRGSWGKWCELVGISRDTGTTW